MRGLPLIYEIIQKAPRPKGSQRFSYNTGSTSPVAVKSTRAATLQPFTAAIGEAEVGAFAVGVGLAVSPVDETHRDSAGRAARKPVPAPKRIWLSVDKGV